MDLIYYFDALIYYFDALIYYFDAAWSHLLLVIRFKRFVSDVWSLLTNSFSGLLYRMCSFLFHPLRLLMSKYWISSYCNGYACVPMVAAKVMLVCRWSQQRLCLCADGRSNGYACVPMVEATVMLVYQWSNQRLCSCTNGRTNGYACVLIVEPTVMLVCWWSLQIRTTYLQSL